MSMPNRRNTCIILWCSPTPSDESRSTLIYWYQNITVSVRSVKCQSPAPDKTTYSHSQSESNFNWSDVYREWFWNLLTTDHFFKQFVVKVGSRVRDWFHNQVTTYFFQRARRFTKQWYLLMILLTLEYLFQWGWFVVNLLKRI